MAAKYGAIVPLIAETGGINAMLADSSALPEQVVGNTAELATDVGPVIDAEAFERIQRHIARLHSESKVLLAHAPSAQAATNSGANLVANLIAPHAFEVKSIADVKAEIFGPVLQVVRWGGDPADVIAQINALGYGLTLGIQTRIDSRAQALAAAAHVGNIYVNRNMIGAVVGVQPFGGEGLSGTGPKAGGPHYLYRFCAEQTVTVNTTAAGGNAALLAAQH